MAPPILPPNTVICPNCNGTGSVLGTTPSGSQPVTCGVCRGNGWLNFTSPPPPPKPAPPLDMSFFWVSLVIFILFFLFLWF